MKTIRVYRLHPSPALFHRLKAAQMEAAAVWNTCCDLHQAARQAHTPWPGQHELHQATKHRFALHSQSVQAIFRAFLGTINTTRQLRHKATRAVIDFCVERRVGSLFIGNPHGVRQQNKGRHHNQRMAVWEYGRDIDYLTHKSKQAHISCFTGSERGTSSRCPRCGHTHKPKGRNWACRACGFTGHRDLVGSVNMHVLAYGSHVLFPRSFTYLRPGLSRSSRRADTPQCCLCKPAAQPLLVEQVSSETGYPVGVAQKPVSL